MKHQAFNFNQHRHLFFFSIRQGVYLISYHKLVMEFHMTFRRKNTYKPNCGNQFLLQKSLMDQLSYNKYMYIFTHILYKNTHICINRVFSSRKYLLEYRVLFMTTVLVESSETCLIKNAKL